MSRSKDTLHVFIAVTETSSIPDLWQAALRTAGDSPAEFVALYLHDERWHRAASLPFTREISKTAGTAVDFTLRRAEQLLSDAARQLKNQIDKLASEAERAIAFEVLPESDQVRARGLISAGESVLILPSILHEHPICGEVTGRGVRVLFVECGLAQA